MHIDKNILFGLILLKLDKTSKISVNKQRLIDLVHQNIYNDPTKNFVYKSKLSEWSDLPDDKSLFHCLPNIWLPIGNLTSQLYANIYMDQFDQYCKHKLKLKYYGRYVDDFVIVYQDKKYLRSLIPILSDYLLQNLWLTIHPRKIYLQHFSKWVKFCWSFIKPYRIYINNRTIIRFKSNIYNLDILDQKWINKISSINSYLWLLKHYKSRKIKDKIMNHFLSQNLWYNLTEYVLSWPTDFQNIIWFIDSSFSSS